MEGGMEWKERGRWWEGDQWWRKDGEGGGGWEEEWSSVVAEGKETKKVCVEKPREGRW
jgi:hypothetical protein